MKSEMHFPSSLSFVLLVQKCERDVAELRIRFRRERDEKPFILETRKCIIMSEFIY